MNFIILLLYSSIKALSLKKIKNADLYDNTHQSRNINVLFSTNKHSNYIGNTNILFHLHTHLYIYYKYNFIDK